MPLPAPLPSVAPFEIPPGYGFTSIPKHLWSIDQDPDDPLSFLYDCFQIWEPPKKGYKYVLAADIGEGVGRDFSVATVLRVATMKEPHEEVAQFVSNQIDPVDFAYYVDVIGRFYADEDGVEALAAVETNGPGLATQSMLQRHLGYSNFYVWQYEGAATIEGRYGNVIGWRTSLKTRRYMLTYLMKALFTSIERDRHGNWVASNTPDVVVNSPITRAEMPEFQTDGARWEAAAASGANDDALMCLGIAVFIAQTIFDEGNEPLAETRRRLALQQQLMDAESKRLNRRRDFVNTDVTEEEMKNDWATGEWNEPDEEGSRTW